MPDPGNVQTAVDRYRDLAKYLIGILAAIGALMVAGTQLSSIGELSWSDDAPRLIAAFAGLAVALAAVVWVVWRALDVLRPVEMSLAEIDRRPKLRKVIESEPRILAGAKRVSVLAALIRDSTLTSPDQRQKWRQVAARVRDRAALLEMQRRFDRAWREMIGAALIGAAGIALLAWAANPGSEEASGEPDALVAPIPTPVLISLTNGGRQALGEAVGRQCPEPIPGLATGGSRTRPVVVTTATDPRCKPAQFVLSPTWGHANNLERVGK
ncbi:MAG TPA: hypothetical protein VMS11_15225 [Solirubrobacterales bacterium]|nr:hypothetical protein [Solirubrobacterales bacterium]